ncbi:DUF6538 domain-containing protein [Azospirillum sp.]|uniref:DUF6538 domain-containing protein n=1 Tax=Azospirillum sp. TaxID=34012 RepID=UPI00261B7822|nr:DUF6538 domain-containing protein [Azospirillum sp.]
MTQKTSDFKVFIVRLDFMRQNCVNDASKGSIMPTYLTKSRGRYFFAIGIPERHRAAVRETWPNDFPGATTIRKSLGTTDPHEAMRRVAPLIAL